MVPPGFQVIIPTVEGHYYYENGMLVLEVKADERKLRVQIKGDALLLDDGDSYAAGNLLRLERGGFGDKPRGFFEALRGILGVKQIIIGGRWTRQSR